MKKPLNIKKFLLPNIPYVFIALFATKLGQAWRLAPGTDFSGKALHLMEGFAAAFRSALPSFHPIDLCVGVAAALLIRLIVYVKGKNAKKFRKNLEYGSARWGRPEDIAPYVDPKFENNVILTQTERLMMSNRPKDPKTARNKNVLVVGGSGSGKTGLMYCADCGGKMYVHRTNNGKRISQYTCSRYTKIPCGTLCKTQHRINEDVVLSLVSDMLKAIAEYAKLDRTEFVRVVREAHSGRQTKEIRKQRTRLATAKQRLSELETLLCKIYEDNALGKLSDSRYQTLGAQYDSEQSKLTAEVSALEKSIHGYEKHEKDADRFISLIDKYESFDSLTIAMLNEFIEKILVHERDRKGSREATQEVEIYFNFVGRFVPPAFGEAELTPEELEERRKKEERKDRLHQNYLKRKASGKHQAYENKIKDKRKADIDAKKAAIRAEDIAKGVFVPVCQLPAREPKKGEQTA